MEEETLIIIDSRKGSGELFPLFPQGLSMVDSLDYGDMSFFGRGNSGTLLSVGIERKCIKDLVNSIATGRLSGHQIPGLMRTYDMIYLIVEGMWRENPQSGLLECKRGKDWIEVALGRRRFMAKEVTNYLNTLAVKIGDQTGGRFYIWRTINKYETVRYITHLYHWWTNKDLDEHRAHLKDHEPYLFMCKPSIVYRMAKNLDLIGDKKAEHVAEKFETVVDMVMADEDQWRDVPGIGKKLAKDIVKSLREKDTKT